MVLQEFILPNKYFMSNFSNIIFPQNIPETGQANYISTPVGPEFGTSVYTPITDNVPATVGPNIEETVVVIPETGQASKEGDTYNIAPAVGTANITPITGPIGVQPHFKPTTENWTQNYGSGGF